ncbi:MAG: hypothetical protein ABDH21_03350 [bacterium]
MAGINPQLILTVLPTVISTAKNAIDNVNERYKQEVETHYQKQKEFNDIIYQEIKKRKETDKKLFEQLRNDNSTKHEKQQSICSSWSQALGTNIEWE